MAAPYCLRIAIEACRPTLVSSKSPVLRLRPLFQIRNYATPADSIAPGATGDIQTTSPLAQPDIANSPSPSSRSHQIGAAAGAAVEPPTISEPASSATTEPAKPLPPNVLAAYRAPMRHDAPHGLPCASLQLRSYSVRNLEFFADFCLRAAYYLSLPARGPNPLPRRIERWTVLKSNFVHKKSQENLERITHKRLITVLDADRSAVETWLAFIRKWQFYGVGMKANVWAWEGLEVAREMDSVSAQEVEAELDEKLRHFGFSGSSRRSLDKMLERQGPKQVGVPMSGVRERSTTVEQRRMVEFD